MEPGKIPSIEDFSVLMRKVTLAETDLVVERYKPGSSGEAALYNDLVMQTEVDDR